MSKPDRSAESMERLFEAIRSFHEKNPDLRVGQIISHAASLDGSAAGDPFYGENDALAKALTESK